ncbi:MAG: hypothetical protein VZQ47_04155 [Treponema sp.]|nr:hypothetical protein [Treponema sp.]MEE3434734.1 hypothetical protein [Treponema sp.]
MKKFFAKALVRAAFIAACLAFCACKDISVMVDEYNANCTHERIWGNDTGSSFKYDARLLIPEESYTFAKDKMNKIILSCVVPNKWYLKYDDGAEEDYPQDFDEYKAYLEERMGALQDVEDPLDPTNPEYTYASVFFNKGRIRADNGQFYNTIIEISPASTGLAPGDYKLFVMAWLHDDYYIDVAEVTVTE